MPMIDMSLEKLKEYNGSSPCPKDFDQYWDDALSEMNALDPAPEFVPNPIPIKNAECFDLYFNGTKGAKLHALFMKPKNVEGKIPAVLAFHGLSGSAGAFSDHIIHVQQGYCVAVLDSRGQGGLSTSTGPDSYTTYSTPFIRGVDGDKHDLLMRDCFLDTALIAKIIMNLPYVDETRVAATGGSQGGGLSVACAALVPEIKKCAPIYPYLSDYRRVWNMDLAKGAYEGLNYYFRHFDPLHEHEDELFERLGYIDIQNFAKRIRAEVMMFTGLMDTTCPPSTQFAMYNKLTCKKQVKIYPDFGHEGLPMCNDIRTAFLADL